MARFRIGPHMRLQEWVADEKGYFAEEGLDYEFVELSGVKQLSVKSAVELPRDQIRGAYQTIEQGRSCDLSGACHWTVNMAAAAGHGRLWGDLYSVAPAGIYVPPDSPVRRPQDLAGVPITVGFQSGSHYATIQALEPFLDRDRIKLHFGGMLMQRIDLMLNHEVPAATMFNAPMYLLEQLGFRKVLDCTFMVASVVPQDVDNEDLAKCYRALKRAQQDIDLRFERYTHYYKRELPEKYHALLDPRLCGPGERIVFLPYTEAMFRETQAWVAQRGIFEGALAGRAGSESSVVHTSI